MSFHPERWTTKRFEKLFDHYNRLCWDGTMPRCQIELADFDPYGMRKLTEAEVEMDRLLACVENHDNDLESRDSLLRQVAGFGGKKREFLSELDRRWRLQIRRTNARNRWMTSC